jgi:hypothetical protein
VSLAVAAIAVVVGGCTWRHTVTRTESGAPKYDRLHVVYELREGRGVLGSPAIQPVKFVEGEEGGSHLVDQHLWSAAMLAVEYPHPQAREGHARATLRLSPTQAADGTDPSAAVATHDPRVETSDTAERQEEIWVLDLPREQLDLLLVDLARSGFFEDQTRPAGGAKLAVRLDAGREAKAWDPEPRLDDLAERVYSEGWIHAFSTPDDTERPWWALR